VVDASEAVMAVHQNHDHGYHLAGKTGVLTEELSRQNYELAGGRWHLRTIDDATHVLGRDGLWENPRKTKRAAERILRSAKEAVWMTAMDWTRPVRTAVGIRKKGMDATRHGDSEEIRDGDEKSVTPPRGRERWGRVPKARSTK
jgi:hypothetical protein